MKPLALQKKTGDPSVLYDAIHQQKHQFCFFTGALDWVLQQYEHPRFLDMSTWTSKQTSWYFFMSHTEISTSKEIYQYIAQNDASILQNSIDRAKVPVAKGAAPEVG